MAEVNYVCPHCGSENVQSFELAWVNGQHKNDGIVTGGGVSRGGLFGGGAKVTGTSQSVLSQSVAPPVEYSYVRELLTVFIGIPVVFAIVGIFLFPHASGTWAWVPMIAYLYFHTYKVAYNYNKNIYPEEMERCHHSWICLKCGNRFIKYRKPILRLQA